MKKRWAYLRSGQEGFTTELRKIFRLKATETCSKGGVEQEEGGHQLTGGG